MAARERTPSSRRASRAPSTVKLGAEERLSSALHFARLDALLGRTTGAGRPTESRPNDELTELVERTASYFAMSVSESTRKTYSRRWHLFELWCADRSLNPLPAAPETLMLYLADSARNGAALGTVRGWCAAINRVHLEAGLAAPGDDPAMTTFMRGISRVARRGVPMQMSALRIGDLRAVCRHLQTLEVDPVDVRDRALLALSARGLSDGAISRLMWSDVTIARQGISIRIARAGHDTTDASLELRRQKRRASCPVDAMTRWRAVAEGHGPVFTGVGRPDLVHHGLSPKGVFSVRRSRLTAIGNRDRWPADDTPLTVLSGTPSEVLRDKAVLLVGFAGAFRRVDMTRITWDDVTAVPEGLVIHLTRSKTDITGRGRDVGIPRGQSRLTCPVRSLQAWRGRVERQLGADAMVGMPIFVQVGRSGRIGTEPLTASALTRMVKRRAEEAGLQGHWGGRSLRAGFISTAADLEIPLELIARQSRHATLDSLILYIRYDDPFRRNSASRLGM